MRCVFLRWRPPPLPAEDSPMDVAAADEGQGGTGGAGAGGGGMAGAGDAQCVICMTEVERHEAGVQLPCSHLFHGK